MIKRIVYGWIHNIYLQNASIWTVLPQKEDSALFKKLLQIRDSLVHVGGGTQEAINLITQWKKPTGFAVSKAYEMFRPQAMAMEQSGLESTRHPGSLLGWVYWGNLTQKTEFTTLFRTWPMCSVENESIEHLFFKCSVSKGIWNSIKCWLGISRGMNSLKSAASWMRKEARGTGPQARAKKIALASTVHQLWLARNARYFDGVVVSPQSIISKIKIYVYTVMYAAFPHLKM